MVCKVFILSTNFLTVPRTCRPAYCFRRTCGKNVLGTKVVGDAVPERSTNYGWPAIQQVRYLCVYFFIFVFPFAPDLLHCQIMRLDMTYRIVNQSINKSVNQSINQSTQSIKRRFAKHGVFLHIS